MRISVIVPVYNVAPYLRECLESIAGRRVEVICVDDGSTDGSAEILDEFQRETKGQCEGWRIVVVHQANAGVAAARNAGLEIATGDWIGFVDGDDVVRDDWIELVSLAICQNPEADAVHFGMSRFERRSELDWRRSATRLHLHRYESEMPDVFHAGGFSAKIYRRSLIGDLRFPVGYTRGEDRLFLVNCAERMNAVVEINQDLYGYRQREGSATMSALTAESLRSELWLLEQYRIWRSSDRRYPAIRWRRLVQDLTEWYAFMFFNAAASARRGAWAAWRDALLELRGDRRFPLFNRVCLFLFSVFRFKLTAFVLFYLPHWAKLKGLHR